MNTPSEEEIREYYQTLNQQVSFCYANDPESVESDDRLLETYQKYFGKLTQLSKAGSITREGRRIRENSVVYVRSAEKKALDELHSRVLRKMASQS